LSRGIGLRRPPSFFSLIPSTKNKNCRFNCRPHAIAMAVETSLRANWDAWKDRVRVELCLSRIFFACLGVLYPGLEGCLRPSVAGLRSAEDTSRFRHESGNCACSGEKLLKRPVRNAPFQNADSNSDCATMFAKHSPRSISRSMDCALFARSHSLMRYREIPHLGGAMPNQAGMQVWIGVRPAGSYTVVGQGRFRMSSARPGWDLAEERRRSGVRII
jgi:hypothetical protein